MGAKVSIIIPLFNKEKFIGETLQSVRNQTFQDWECIIVNDGSTDKSPIRISPFVRIDTRFQYFESIKNCGASSARNFGLGKATGEYIQFLDADDILSSNKLDEQLRVAEAEKNISLLTCWWGGFGKDGNGKFLFEDLKSYSDFKSSYSFLNSLISSKGYFPIHAYLIRKKLIITAGPWNENLALNDDGEFMSRVISNAKEIRFVPKAAVWYRSSEGDNLSEFKKRKNVEKAIYSWQLIDAYLKIRYEKQQIDYVEWAKGKLFLNVRRSFPELLKVHATFFAEQLKQERKNNSLLFRITRKLKSWT